MAARRVTRVRGVALCVGLGVLALAAGGGAATRVAPGKMTVTPTRVTAGSTNELSFGFTADTAALRGTALVDVPRGWSKPQQGAPAAPGYVELQASSCAGTRISGYVFLTQTRPAGAPRKTPYKPLGPRKQAVVKVRGAAVTGLFITLSSVVTAGQPFNATVRAVDAFGNNAADYAGTVALTSTDAAATMPAAYAYGPTDVAQHTFTGLVLKTVGTQRVAATDSHGFTVQSGPITVSPFSS
jgi:hypothetical protein